MYRKLLLLSAKAYTVGSLCLSGLPFSNSKAAPSLGSTTQTPSAASTTWRLCCRRAHLKPTWGFPKLSGPKLGVLRKLPLAKSGGLGKSHNEARELGSEASKPSTTLARECAKKVELSYLFLEGPTARHLRFLVPKAMPSLEFSTSHLKYSMAGIE